MKTAQWSVGSDDISASLPSTHYTHAVSSEALIIVGASTRAAAQSAQRAGMDCWCVDLFADRDLQAVARRALRCDVQRYPETLPELVKKLGAPAGTPLLLTGAMENHLNIVDALLTDRPTFGCTAQAMAMSRDPLSLARLPDVPGVQFPAAFTHIPVGVRLLDKLRFWRKRRWLVKPYRSAGGAKIHLWDGKSPPGEGQFLQQFAEGIPMAATFRSDGWSSRLLGVTKQIIGDPKLGSGGYRYVGSVGPIAFDEAQRESLRQLGVMLTQRFDLRGTFGVDFILDKHGITWPIEINPRYTASMEIIERTGGPLVLADTKRDKAQRAADDARRKDMDGKPKGTMLAKGFVFAMRDGVTPDLYELFDKQLVADVPATGEPIREGQPVCTLFGWGDDEAQAVAQLHEAAGRLYTRLHA